jgi:arsenate reductase
LKKILFVCTGNTCRSQMAEGLARSMYPDYHVASAGTRPGTRVNVNAIQVMKELGINIGNQRPEAVSAYLHEDWVYVITLCDNANRICPEFTGTVGRRLHFSVEDPYDATGSAEEIQWVYREVRDHLVEIIKQLDKDQTGF